MPITEWSDGIFIAELSDEPTFSEEMDGLMRRLAGLDPALPDVIVNMQSVSYLNSSNIAALLKLRKKLLSEDARLRVCAVTDGVWSVLMTTGLDTVFDFTDDVATSLASLQIDE